MAPEAGRLPRPSDAGYPPQIPPLPQRLPADIAPTSARNERSRLDTHLLSCLRCTARYCSYECVCGPHNGERSGWREYCLSLAPCCSLKPPTDVKLTAYARVTSLPCPTVYFSEKRCCIPQAEANFALYILPTSHHVFSLRLRASR